MALDHSAKGVFAISATPFLPDGALDLDSLDQLTDFYLACGCTGLTILGILGEAHKLEPAESLAVVRRVMARAGSAQVIVGVSAPGFATMRSLTRAAMEMGAAGVMIAPPSHLRTDDQIAGYYVQAARAIGPDVPICVQDHPLVTGVQMSVPVVCRIFAEVPSCVMLKHEDWPGLDKLATLRKAERDGSLRPISILCGNGGLFLDFEMDRGADGAMTGYAFPDMLADLVRLSAAGARDAAHDLFDAHLPLLRYEQQPAVGLSVRKYILRRRGAIAHDGQRAPGATLTAATREDVDYLLARLSRLDPRAGLG
ncbi:MAG: dihydrodipicolinate synthase family protein [Rhodobacteraceae bacterium]|jgi:4-hydroxy-tetrahydrodipicolinate synthase|nr:dihydrodipicolinate synthase family protein [Paracoccaceae bacterium]